MTARVGRAALAVGLMIGFGCFAGMGGGVGCSSDDSDKGASPEDGSAPEGASSAGGDSGIRPADGSVGPTDASAWRDAGASDATVGDANDASPQDGGAGDATSHDGGDGGVSDAGAIDASAEDAAAGDANADAGDAKAGPTCGGDLGSDRPVQLHLPPGYDCSTAAPLVILLHDYGSSGALAEQYFNLTAQADALGFLYAHPDGTIDSAGNQFWNATDACCNVDGSTVNDSQYLSDLVSAIGIKYNLDRTRVAVIGYGNGGFMAYRFACDHSPQITAVVDLGGATWSDGSKCPLEAPVGVLEIHGTADATFAYDGGTNLGNAYPSAPTTIADWIGLSRCTADAGAPGANLDLDSTLAGAETTAFNWPKCPGGTKSALWSIQGGSHQPTLSPTFASSVVSFLLAQSKP